MQLEAKPVPMAVATSVIHFQNVQALKKDIVKVLGQITDKKSKKRQLDCKAFFNASWHQRHPNFTCQTKPEPTGKWMMHESVARNRFNCEMYWHHKKMRTSKNPLSNKQFITSAQVEAVLFTLAMLIQVGSN